MAARSAGHSKGEGAGGAKTLAAAVRGGRGAAVRGGAVRGLEDEREWGSGRLPGKERGEG